MEILRSISKTNVYSDILGQSIPGQVRWSTQATILVLLSVLSPTHYTSVCSGNSNSTRADMTRLSVNRNNGSSQTRLVNRFSIRLQIPLTDTTQSEPSAVEQQKRTNQKSTIYLQWLTNPNRHLNKKGTEHCISDLLDCVLFFSTY